MEQDNKKPQQNEHLTRNTPLRLFRFEGIYNALWTKAQGIQCFKTSFCKKH